MVAAANVPTVRTTVGLSTLKVAGSVAVAEVPMPSKFWVYGVLVESAICASRQSGGRAMDSKAAKRNAKLCEKSVTLLTL